MPSIPPAPTGSAGLLIAALSALATPAWAIDWDGDFPNTGNYNGKVDDPANWAFNNLPGPSDGASFLAPGAYTVAFGVDFESGGGDISNGDVTFQSISTSTRTYAISGVLNVNSALTLDGVDFAQGSLNNFSVRVRNGGSLLMMDGDQGFSNILEVGSSTTDGSVTIDNTGYQTNSLQVMGAGGGGAFLTLQNNAELEVSSGGVSNLLMGRFNNYDSHLDILGGSSVSVGSDLLMANIDGNNGNAEVMLSGVGSSLSVGGDTEVGSQNLGAASITLGAGTSAAFSGAFTLDALGQFTNNGGTTTIFGQTDIGGSFTQTAGTSNLIGPTTFDAAASFSHTGGLIRFRDATTIAIQDIDFGSPTEPNEATWDIGSEVVFNRRLRVGSAEDSYGLIEVADNGGTQGILRNTAVSGQADLAIGYAGTGELQVTDQGVVDIFDDVIIGQLANGVGRVFVTGNGSADPNDRSVLLVNRNGSGSNLFVGLEGDGLLSVVGGGRVEVGNDLVVQAIDTAGIVSILNVGVDPSLELESADTVFVGNDLLIGNIGGMGGTSSGLAWVRDTGFVSVQGHTHVRSTGELIMDLGGVLSTNALTTEATAEFDIDGGAVRVFGQATLNHGDLVVNGDASVPNQMGRGSFEVYSGGDAVVAGDVVLGDGAGESGRLLVNGAGSTFSQTPGLRDAIVGDGGDGQVIVSNGGLLEINREMRIARSANSVGRVSISGVAGGGTRSSLVIDALGDVSNIEIGTGNATAELEVSDGGLVQITGGVTVGNPAMPGPGDYRVTIGGSASGFAAELRSRYLYLNGSAATLEINDGALVNLQPNNPFSEVLYLNGPATMVMTGGEVFAPRFNISAGAVVQWTGGTLRVDEVTGDLTNNGGTLAPGSDPADTLGGAIFDDDYTQASAGTLQIEIAGTTRGTQYDYVDIGGTLSLAGTLQVVLSAATPNVGDSYDLLDWGTLVGTFDSLDLPGVGNGNTWGLDNLYTTGVIEVIRSGDLDSDGSVGVADLDIILAHWGQSVTPFDETMGDASGDGFVDNDDLQIVLDQFGDTTYPGTSSIPEPATATLLLLALAGLQRRR